MEQDDTLLLLSGQLFDIQKGKGNRDGLVQQIITYVRDGRTVTRKQWVRSEFAEHAKKNEESKRRTELNQKVREDNARTRRLQDSQYHKDVEDRRAKAKQKHRKKELEESSTHHSGGSHVKDVLSDTKKKLARMHKQEETKKREEQQKKDREKTNSKTKDKDKRSRFGQSDQTRADNKADMNTATQYTPPQHN